nr:AAA family ATPase [Mycoplana azooxidifex]
MSVACHEDAPESLEPADELPTFAFDPGEDALAVEFDDGLDATKPLPVRLDLVDELIPQVGRVGIVGPSGSGKTFAVGDLAAAVVTKTEFAARDVMRQGGFAYLAYEASGTIDARWKGLREKYGPALDGKPFFPVRNPPPLDTENGWNRLKATLVKMHRHCVEKYGLPLVACAIDTVHASGMVMDENDANGWSVALRHLKDIADTLGIAAIIVHHSGKSGDGAHNKGETLNLWRGSSSAPAAMDSVIGIKVEKRDGHVSRRQMFHEKSRDGETGYIADIETKSIKVGMKANGKPLTTLILHFNPNGREERAAEVVAQRVEAKRAKRKRGEYELPALQAIRRTAIAECKEVQMPDGRHAYDATTEGAYQVFLRDAGAGSNARKCWDRALKALAMHDGLEIDDRLMRLSIITDEPIRLGAFAHSSSPSSNDE